MSDDKGERYVRVIGDGNPANMQLLDMDGARIPEAVTRIEITIAVQQFARGVFTYYVEPPPKNHDAFDTFEAFVVFGPL